MNGARRYAALWITAALLVGCGDAGDRAPAPANDIDDEYQQRLDELTEEYHKNREKLMSDWRLVLAEVEKGDIDTSKLTDEIRKLTGQLDEKRQWLEKETRELKQMKGKR